MMSESSDKVAAAYQSKEDRKTYVDISIVFVSFIYCQENL